MALMDAQAAAGAMLECADDLDGVDALAAAALTLSILCARLAQDTGGSADRAADLARPRQGAVERRTRAASGQEPRARGRPR